METEGLLSFSQDPASGLYSEADESNIHTQNLFPQNSF
jgi:hypothetical protein